MHKSWYDVLRSYEGFDFFWGDESQVLAWVADPRHVVSHPSFHTVLIPCSMESEIEKEGETGFKVQFVMPLICALSIMCSQEYVQNKYSKFLVDFIFLY